MVRLLVTFSAAALVAGCSNALSPDEYVALVEAARGCAPRDRCVFAGSTQCTCAVPITAARVADIESAGTRIDCGGVFAHCLTPSNLRCEKGRCIGDTAPHVDPPHRP